MLPEFAEGQQAFPCLLRRKRMAKAWRNRDEPAGKHAAQPVRPASGVTLASDRTLQIRSFFQSSSCSAIVLY
jgi:hypothetical protein